jgi:hypothetical protein
MSRERPPVSELALERFALGELPPDRMAELRARLETDEELRSRLSELERSDAEILAALPPGPTAAAIAARAKASAPKAAKFPRPLLLALPAAAAIALAATLALSGELSTILGGKSDPVTRMKGGGTRLVLYSKSQGGIAELADGALLGQRDLVQIAYESGAAAYGAIFSLDGRGVVTFHAPDGYRGGSRPAPALEVGRLTPLASAYELDDAPGFERFFFVSSKLPFDLEAADRAVRALARSEGGAERGRLELPSGLEVRAIVVRKKG